MGDLVDRARAALDGVTTGVWHVEGKPWKLIVWSSWSNRVCVMAHSNGFNNKADLANAHFIAAARSLVPEMADEIARLRAENGVLRDDHGRLQTKACVAVDAARNAEAESTRLRAEVERLRKMALPFVAVHGERWSRERGLPDWHMAAHFYDMVKDLGGQVDGFIRVEMNADPVAEDIRALTPEARHD